MTTVISGWNPVTGMYREDEPNAPTEQQASLEMRKGKQTGKVITYALPEGVTSMKLYLVIRGAPYLDTGGLVAAGKTKVTITLKPKEKR
jgi:hypothetical protein